MHDLFDPSEEEGEAEGGSVKQLFLSIDCERQSFLNSSGLRENNDCTVKGLARASGVLYAVAHSAMKAAGRKERKGVRLAALIEDRKIPGFLFRNLNIPTMTIARFVRENPTGRFLIRRRKHAFAIADGVVLDDNKRKPLDRITHAWVAHYIYQ